MFFRIICFPINIGSNTHLRFMSTVKFTQSKFSISLLVPLLFKRIPLWLQWYLGLLFELFIKQIFLLPHSFFRKLFTCAAFAFDLSRRGTIPNIQILLLSDLQDAVNSKIFCPTLTALVFCLKSLVPQCKTINSGLFDIVGCVYDFMSSWSSTSSTAVFCNSFIVFVW